MFYGVNKASRIRARLFLGGATLATLGVSVPAAAQQGGGTVETVVVTGSRIPQTGVYAASPVTAVGQQELKFEGTTDVSTLINNLPESFVGQSANMSNGSVGTATVNLRGLGSSRTLVLVNGTRLMPGDPIVPSPDLNDIPAALVDHVEVLTGGASAVYGSDALAGVVNFIMRKDFEGVEADGTYSVYNNNNDTSRWRADTQTLIDGGAFGFAQSKEGIWNGATADASLIMGTNTANDKGNVTAYLSYRNTQPVLESTRDYSECTLVSTGTNLECAGSSNFNRFISIDDLAAGQSFDFFEHGTGQPGSGNFVPYTGAPAQKFNYGALNYLQRPDTRYTGGFFAHYQENKQLDLYSSLMFADDHTVAQIAPSGLFLGSGTVSGYLQEMNCGNPLMTPQENKLLCGTTSSSTTTVIQSNGKPFTFFNGAGNIHPGQALLEIGRRDIEGGDRQADFRHTAYRMNIGARGDLGNGWSYDVYAQYGLALLSETYLNEFSKNRVQQALEVDPVTGQCIGAESGLGNSAPTAPGCVPLDIFNGLGAINKAQLGYVSANGFQEGFTQEQVVSGSLTGDLGEWGGQSPWAKNPIGVSVGAEWRSELLKLSTDQEYTTNDLYGQGAPTLSVPESGFNVSEGFTEVKVPLIQGVPWIEDLTFNGGYRYSSYSTAGSTNAYKYGAEWQPIDDFRLRGSVQRAVRAPNVLELFAPKTVSLFSGQDPCAAGASGVVLANCLKEGVTDAGSTLLLCPANQCNQQTAGNVLLKPETSDTKSVGVVFTPTFLDGFTATVDYFHISISKFIGFIPPNLTLSECYGATATAQSQAFFCPFVQRQGVGHQIYGSGFVADNNLNTGFLKTRGIDFEMNYTSDLATWGLPDTGSLAFNLVGTWLDTLVSEPLPITALTSTLASNSIYNCAGLFGATCSSTSISSSPNPKWRHKLRVTWATPWDVDFSLAWRYIGAVSFDANTSDPLVGGSPVGVVCPNGQTVQGGGTASGGDCADARISSYSYFDLSGDWTVRQGIDLRAGVNNIFDIEPPVLGSSAGPLGPFNGNTYSSTYDGLGREVFVSATIKY